MGARMRMMGFGVLCAVALVGGAFNNWAQKDTGKQGGAPQMTEKQKAEMEAWQKLASPGEAHKKLNSCVGTFDAKVKMWMAPGAPADESMGVDEAKWILDGRFVQDTFTGTAMGMPFTGLGMTGYDNHQKKYVGTWQDTWSTHIQTMKGDMDSSGKVLTMTSTIFDPMQQKDKKIRQVTRYVDDKTHTFEVFEPGADGKEFRSMEIVFTKR
jgi:hypothetical protein